MTWKHFLDTDFMLSQVGVTLWLFIFLITLTAWVFFRRSLRLRAKKAEENERRFQLLIESVKDYAILILDPQGFVSTWNKGAQNLKGYQASEIIGQHFSKFYAPEAVRDGTCEAELIEAAETGRFEDEGWRVRKDGSRFWANVILTPIRNSHGDLLGFAKVTRDLTERVKTEAQLKEAQAIAHLGSWEWDIEQDKISWSDELYRVQDVDPREFKTSYTEYLQRLDPRVRDQIQALVKKCRETGEEYNFEHRVVHRDGSVHEIHSRGRAVRNEQGHIVKLRGTSQDVTERKINETKLMQAQDELEARVRVRTAELHRSLEREKRATEAKMQFLANMSHEIRTPMNAILGFSELLMAGNLTKEQLGYLGRVRSNSDLLLKLIDDILDLSKFEAGRIPIEKSNFSVVEMIDDLLHSFELIAKKKGLSIQAQFLTPIPQSIFSDPMRLRQILTNILSNAIKFTPSGKVEMRLSYEKSQLVIDVEDSGIGITETDQLKLFKAFSQADSSINRKFGGTGLGLVLARRMTEALDGSLVLLKSETQKGSCFRIILRLQDGASTPMVTELPPTKSAASPISPAPSDAPLLPAKILLAEDSLDNEILVRHFLQGCNMKIDVAVNGIEAMEMALRNDYDCILMDVQMPMMDGLEATRNLRAQGYQKPIIALTAHALQQEVEKSMAAGCNVHMTKPINRQLLLQTIRAQTLA